MNKLTQRIAMAGLAGSALIGGFAFNMATSSAQTTSSTTTQPAATAAANGTTKPADAPKDCDHGQGRERGGERGRLNLDVAAKAIGISADDLRTALQADGATIAKVATAHNVSPQTVIDALVNDVQTHLSQDVSDGKITQAQADQRLTDAKTRIADHVNNGRPAKPADRPARPMDNDADAS